MWVEKDIIYHNIHSKLAKNLYSIVIIVWRANEFWFFLDNPPCGAVSRFKRARPWTPTPGSPQRHSRPPCQGLAAMPAAAHPGSPAASQRVSFSDPLVSPPSQQEQPNIRPGTVFLLPLREDFWAGSSFTASTEVLSATPAETAYKDRSLTFSALLPRPVLGGSSVEAAYALVSS